ncbi:MAG: hypothetical protein J6D38_05240, partial [Solobacterium sp.]|nr:hypothetical protein [Solobacterium sp.]
PLSIPSPKNNFQVPGQLGKQTKRREALNNAFCGVSGLKLEIIKHGTLIDKNIRLNKGPAGP